MTFKDKLIQAYYQNEKALSFQDQRKKSIMQLEKNGFPTVKDEEWKYTNPLPILKQDYQLSALSSDISKEQLSQYILTETDTYCMVFVNGQFSDELSSIEGVKCVICPLSVAETQCPEVIKAYWGKALPEQADSFVSLNNALCQEGTFIHVPKGVVVDKPIQIIYLTNGVSEDIFLQNRNIIIAEENSQVQLTERYQNTDSKSVFTNVVTEIFAHKDSIVDFYKIQNDQRNCSMIDNTWVNQDKQSSCTVDTFSFGSKFIRNNLSFTLNGQHAESNMRGVTLIGENQLVDHHTLVDHAVPNCLSNELYKGIYDDNARGVFNGKVMVRPDAQKTNAFQSNNNLLLTDEASIDTKPQLEIYADDVACSHGCTIGQLDEDALFYLRSRGIPFKEAQATLMYAFANDVLSNVKIPELKQKLNRIIAEKLGVDISLEL